MIIRDRQMVGRKTKRKIICSPANKSQPVLPYCKPYNKEALILHTTISFTSSRVNIGANLTDLITHEKGT